MEFDIIIATRNRQMVLQLSIQLMLTQNRLPQSLIIIDSSDDFELTKKTVQDLIYNIEVNVELQIYHSRAGSALQRNLGLQFATSPIVMFPDDDSLWFPGVAESIMNIYEKDIEERIGGVAATDSKTPPSGIFKKKNAMIYKMEINDRIERSAFRHLFNLDRYFPDPLRLEGLLYSNEDKEVPIWLEELDASLSPPMTGYRMTFRREVIQKILFDERLGRFAVYEDWDASIAVLQKYLIVKSHKAKVFHYRFPGSRTNEYEFGMMHILNRAYVVCKYTCNNLNVNKKLIRYLYYKLFRYLLQFYSKSGRRKFIGGLKAFSFVNYLIDSPPNVLARRFEQCRDECVKALGGKNKIDN